MRTRWNQMHIDIKNSLIEHLYPHDATLLLRLTHGDSQGIGITIGMPSWLQPAAEFFVQGQQAGLLARMEQESRGGDVTASLCALKTIGVGFDEIQHPLRGLMVRLRTLSITL